MMNGQMALARQALKVERAHSAHAGLHVQRISHHGIFDGLEESTGRGEVVVGRPSEIPDCSVCRSLWAITGECYR